MSLGKQAKTLTEAQEKSVLGFLSDGRHAQRNRVMFLLSVDAGLRAKEIAAITWEMVTDATGDLTDEIRLEDKASKGKSGGVVFISQRLGYEGCSSHSGRRTAITRWSRKISSVGGSLRDVQSLARHSSLQMTQRYIEVSENAMRKVVG